MWNVKDKKVSTIIVAGVLSTQVGKPQSKPQQAGWQSLVSNTCLQVCTQTLHKPFNEEETHTYVASRPSHVYKKNMGRPGLEANM